jgi:predicted transcriptional regulator
MPKGLVQRLYGIFDAQAIYVITSLAEQPRTFTSLQTGLGLPKSSLHRVLEDLVSGKIIARTGDNYSITESGRVIIKTYNDIMAAQQFIDLAELEQRKRAMMPSIFALGLKRVGKTRPKDVAETEILSVMTRNAWLKMLSERRIKKLDKLTYELKN